MQTTTDLYKLLGLPREASQDDIRKAHRNLVRKHHPDANPGDSSSEERFKEIQRAYEVLSDPEKKREYDRKRRASSKGASRRTRASAGRRTESAAPPVDLSDLLRKLTDLSSERSDGHNEGNFQLRGEEIARLAKLLDVGTSRISELLGKDITRLSKLIAESIKMNTKVNPGDGRSGRYQSTGERLSGGKRSGGSNGPREKKVKGPKARRKEKRVRGPRAQRRKQNP